MRTGCFKTDFARFSAFDRHRVRRPNLFVFRVARTAAGDDRLPRRVVFGFDKKICKCGMRLIGGLFVDDDFAVTRNLDFARSLRFICQRNTRRNSASSSVAVMISVCVKIPASRLLKSALLSVKMTSYSCGSRKTGCKPLDQTASLRTSRK